MQLTPWPNSCTTATLHAVGFLSMPGPWSRQQSGECGSPKYYRRGRYTPRRFSGKLDGGLIPGGDIVYVYPGMIYVRYP